MRYLLSILVMSCALLGSAVGQVCVPSTTQTCTPNVSLAIPNANSANWNIPLNQNFNYLDSLLSGSGVIPQINPANLNNILFVDGVKYAQSGAGLLSAVTACLALSSCPGVVAPYIPASSVASTISLSRPITLWLCQVSLTFNGNPGINMSAVGASIEGCGQNASVLTSGGTSDLIQTNADGVKIYNVDLEGNNLASIAIHVVGGNFQKIDKVFANGSSVAELQFEPTIGINSSISNSVFESNLSATPSVNINGNDGCGGGSAIPRHFTNIDTGGTPFNVQGGSTVMLSNSSIGGITMTASACKLFMTGVRELSNPVTFLGTNHIIVGNAFSAAITLDSTLNNSSIVGNVSVGALVNNAAESQNNTVVENDTANSISILPKLRVTQGINADGGGFKHLRGTTGCTTGASVGAACTTVVTWTTTFADANYTAGCSGDLVTSGVPASGGLTAKSASAVTFQTVATTAVAAKFTTIECWAVHD